MKRGHLSECGVCGSNQGLLLHNVRHRGTYRRLCTNCILKCHQGLFCPICLQVYDTSPPPPHASHVCQMPLHLPPLRHRWRVEAERRVKEAALAKKRAREALERLLYLAAEEKERELKKGSVGVLVKSNNGKNLGEKSSNGLYPVPSGAVAGHYQHQESNHGIGK
ncbi:hypothetical protein Patl1_24735 [Pistacia atlantica]|uniref:Uncharacterized protein n=1 Tax=Pistacia atlantica TaxID=434234 RepID=A0ACC1B3G3_9ROSI|nr:hypothetical protein Patl1_24735 [Pistacia atlantica]